MTLQEVMDILNMKKRNIEPTAQELLDSIKSNQEVK